MTSMSSAMSKRKSIGLANLMDATPLSPAHKPPHDRVKMQQAVRRRKSKLSAELRLEKDGDCVSSASPTTVLQVPVAVLKPPRDHHDEPSSDSQDRNDDDDVVEQLRRAEPSGSELVELQQAFVEPTTPRGSPAAAATLFEAIASDSFFKVLASHNMELCGNEQDAQRIRKTTAKSNDTTLPCTPVNVNGFKDSTHGKTLLHQACKTADVQIIKCLLYHGASAAQQCVMGRTPFHDAISSSRRDRAVEVLQILYEYEPQGITLVDINGTHIVHLAAIHGCLDVIQWCAALATTESSPVTVAMSITSFSGRNVLHYAAYNGRLLVLQWLMQVSSCSVPSITALDVNGYSVLHYAAMGGHLDVCQWFIFYAPSRRNLNIVATNTDGSSAFDLARQQALQVFLEDVSQVPSAPCDVECIGVDSCSMGIVWRLEPPTDDPYLLEVLAPKWFELEYCKKPTGLRRASAMLSMLMIMPSAAANAATVSASSYLLTWEKLHVLIQPDAHEYWLSGLESDCEYLVRMRALNRNGYSEYSIPSLSGEFKTCVSGATTQPKRNSFRGLFNATLTRGLVEMSFIGTLDLELLEARRLLYCVVPPVSVSTIRQQQQQRGGSSRRDAASQGHFFAVVTLQVPLEPVDGSAADRRRTSLSLFKSDPDASQSSSASLSATTSHTRCLYRMRTELASVQHDLLAAGSLQAFRHAQFGLRTKLRVPEALDSELIVEIHHETPLVQSSVVGVVRIPLMDFVRGFPAKLQWVELDHNGARARGNACEWPHGELLIRSLFLADGIVELPHPTKVDLSCTTAEELLDDSGDTVASPKANSSRSSIATASSSTSSFSFESTGADDGSPAVSPTSVSQVSTDHPVRKLKYDALGFRIFPPAPREIPTLHTYEYYRLHQQCVARQQDALWMRFHRDHSCSSRTKPSRVARSLAELLQCGEKDDVLLYEPSTSRDSARLRRLVWDGIPSSSRRVLYLRMSGAEAKRRAAIDGYYQQQLVRARDTASNPNDAALPRSPVGFETTRRQIQVDLQRTFAGNQSWINTCEGQDAMERVLLAYAIHNERIGYCQSMSFIVGRLLCLFHHELAGVETSTEMERMEQDVFWLLAVLCEDCFPTYYTKGMEGLHIDGQVLETLLQRRLPKVARHFQVVLQNPSQLGLLLVTGWLLPVFCAVFPSETSFRLLDVLFFERSRVVFAIVIALLRMAQPQVIHETKDYMQLFRLLKQRDQRLHDAALLMEIAWDEHVLLENDIDALRELSMHQFQEIKRSEK